MSPACGAILYPNSPKYSYFNIVIEDKREKLFDYLSLVIV